MAHSPSDARELLLDFAAISTHASVFQDENRLVLRYSDAILAYATALLKNRHDAEDVHMDVVQKMLEGKFTRATSPRRETRGRFRHFVQRAVHNAALNYRRQSSREQSRFRRVWDRLFPRAGSSGEGARVPVVLSPEAEEEDRKIWREAVLKRAMEAALKKLEGYERGRQAGARPNVYHTLARLLIDHPDESRDQLAQRLGEQFGGEFNANQTRGIVMRMREKFAELLVDEIRLQLDEPTLDEVLDELGELGLLAYVKPYLPARGNPDAGA